MMIWLISRLPLFNTFNVHLLSSTTQVCAPISTKWSSLSPKIEKSDSPIWSSAKIYVGQKLKYTSNFLELLMVLLFWAFTITLQNTQNVVFTTLSTNLMEFTQRSPEDNLSSKKCSSRYLHLSSNINHILTPSNHSYPFIRNIFFWCAVNGYLIPVKIINKPPPDPFGEMYTILVPSGVSNTVQHESIDMDPSIYKFTMDINV